MTTGHFDSGIQFDQGTVFGPVTSPLPAVTPTCQVCGQTVFCGGPNCPSSSLPLPPDQVPMIQETYQSVQVWNYQQGEVTMADGTVRTPGLITQVA